MIIELSADLSMVWNAQIATTLTVDKVRRWWVDGSCADWSRRDVTDLLRLACVVHFGTDTDLSSTVADLRRWLQARRLRSNDLIHDLSLAFCTDRAKTNDWTLPDALVDKHHRAVAKLLHIKL